MSITYTYLAPEGAATTTEVTFDNGSWIHTRPVNVVFAEDGSYDAEATEARIAEVAAGVENKMNVGAITAPTEDPAETPEEIPA